MNVRVIVGGGVTISSTHQTGGVTKSHTPCIGGVTEICTSVMGGVTKLWVVSIPKLVAPPLR
jgi:hypothetical protein